MSIEQVKEFHEAFGHPVADKLGMVDTPVFSLRLTLIEEELGETLRDYYAGDFVKFIDGLADLRVVINGAILVFGGYGYAKQVTYHKRTTVRYGISFPSATFIRMFTEKMDRALHSFSIAYTLQNDLLTIVSSLIQMHHAINELCQIFELPIEEIDDAVHKANMSKLGENGKPIYRESDNKILKGPNFRPPEEDIEAILKAHGAEL